MAHKTVLSEHTLEGQTAIITGELKNEAGEAIPGTELATLTMTLYNKGDSAVINERQVFDLLAENNGVGQVDEDGVLTVTLTPADMVIVDARRDLEVHVAQFKWTYGENDEKAGAHEVEFRVYNMTDFTVVPP